MVSTLEPVKDRESRIFRQLETACGESFAEKMRPLLDTPYTPRRLALAAALR